MESLLTRYRHVRISYKTKISGVGEKFRRECSLGSAAIGTKPNDSKIVVLFPSSKD